MLTYIQSGSNKYTLRTEPTASNSFTMSLQDMTRQVNYTASLSGTTYNGYESMLSFTASISGAIVGGEYRATIQNGTTEIWHGSIQVYASQSNTIEEKSIYKNQNDNYSSSLSSNEYIIMN